MIERVETIDVELELGGQICSHCIRKYGYGCITDGKKQYLTEPEYAPETHSNQYHRGCMISTCTARIYEATYVIYCSIGTRMNGGLYKVVQRVILAGANESKVTSIISTL